MRTRDFVREIAVELDREKDAEGHIEVPSRLELREKLAPRLGSLSAVPTPILRLNIHLAARNVSDHFFFDKDRPRKYRCKKAARSAERCSWRSTGWTRRRCCTASGKTSSSHGAEMAPTSNFVILNDELPIFYESDSFHFIISTGIFPKPSAEFCQL